jgi:hypothetical protein
MGAVPTATRPRTSSLALKLLANFRQDDCPGWLEHVRDRIDSLSDVRSLPSTLEEFQSDWSLNDDLHVKIDGGDVTRIENWTDEEASAEASKHHDGAMRSYRHRLDRLEQSLVAAQGRLQEIQDAIRGRDTVNPVDAALLAMTLPLLPGAEADVENCQQAMVGVTPPVMESGPEHKARRLREAQAKAAQTKAVHDVRQQQLVNFFNKLLALKLVATRPA